MDVLGFGGVGKVEEGERGVFLGVFLEEFELLSCDELGDVECGYLGDREQEYQDFELHYHRFLLLYLYCEVVDHFLPFVLRRGFVVIVQEREQIQCRSILGKE